MRIADGRSAFVQWDTGQQIVFDAPCAEAHFAPRTGTVTIDVETRLVGGEYVADVPDELLQTARPVTVYAFVQSPGRYTRQIRSFEVRARPKPADYIYTPTERETWEHLQAQIGDLDKLKTKAKSDLVAAINEAAQSGGGGVADSDIFVIPVTIDLNEETGAGTTTVTFDEIKEAHNDGKTLLCVANDTAQGLSAILTEYSVTATRAAFMALTEGGAITLMAAISKDGTVQYAMSAGSVAMTRQWSYTDEQKEQLRENFDLVAKTDKLANPYALTFGGAVSGTYDGSEAKSITIPDASDIKIYATLDDFIARRFTNRAAMVLNAPSVTITPGAWSDVGFPALAYTSGVSHGEATIYLTSCATAKKCSVSLQMDGSYRGPYAIAATPDHTLGLTAATVGQIAKISAVDDNGVPTAWEPVDMPSGGSEKWELIRHILIPEGAAETNALTINADEDGKPFALKKLRLYTTLPAYTGTSTIPSFSFTMLNGITLGAQAPLAYTSGLPLPGKTVSVGFYEVDLTMPGYQTERQSRWGSVGVRTLETPYWGARRLDGAETIFSIGGTNMLIYPGCEFYLYGVRA